MKNAPRLHVYMSTRTVRLDDEVYERIRSAKREDETFSEAIERLIGDVSLLDLAGNLDATAAAEAKAAIERSREVDRAKAREIADRSERDG